MWNSLTNEDLAAVLSERIGLRNLRQDMPFEDQHTKLLWDEALKTEEAAKKAMDALRHYLMPGETG